MTSLEESIKLEWNGDVDFGDGKLQKLYKTYRQRLLGLEELSKLTSHPQLVLMALNREGRDITDDLKLLTDGMLTLYKCIYACIIIIIAGNFDRELNLVGIIFNRLIKSC